MPSADTLYQIRALALELIERGRDCTLRCSVYDAGALVTIASATVAVLDAGGSEVVATTSAVLSGGVATYALAGSVHASLALSEGWTIVWVLTLPDGTVREHVQEAALVRRRLHPPATAADLWARMPSLDPASTKPITSLAVSGYDAYLDESWRDVEGYLLAQGRRPWLVISSQSLRKVHVLGALALLYRDLAGRLQPAYRELADQLRLELREAWAEVRLVYDTDETGLPDGGAQPTRLGAEATVWTGGLPSGSLSTRWPW